jgi:hypothetical protein
MAARYSRLHRDQKLSRPCPLPSVG